MAGEFERAFRQMLKSVVREVADELIHERRFSHRPSPPQESAFEDRFLLRAREAAKRLAISERHLHTLTVEGVLPCVRVGRLVHYSVKTIEKWIQESESTNPPNPQSRPAATKPKTAAVSPSKRSKKATKAVRAKVSPRTSTEKPKRKKKASTRRQAEAEQKKEKPNPFTLLLREIGIARDSLGPMTNGDLMRIAEVDTPTYHGWMHLNKEMPEEALEKLRRHFSKVDETEDEGES